MVGPTRSCCTLQNCGWRFPGAIAGPQQRAKNASRPTLGLAKAISIEVKTGGPGGGHGCRVFHIWAPFDIPAGPQFVSPSHPAPNVGAPLALSSGPSDATARKLVSL